MFLGLESGHGSLSGNSILWPRLRLGDAPVDLRCRGAVHLIRDVGVDVQRGGGGHMAQDGGESLDVHAVFQSVGSESVPKLV